jgi:hypothetical protein
MTYSLGPLYSELGNRFKMIAIVPITEDEVQLLVTEIVVFRNNTR